MRIVIIGAGKVGGKIAARLTAENHDIVIIDSDDAAVKELATRHDIMGITANGALESTQRSAGVHKSDLLISVTEIDDTNVLCCLIAKALGAKMTVARVRDPELSEQSEFMRKKLGIDVIVNPEREAAEEIAQMLRYPSAETVECFNRAKVDMVAVKIGEDCPIAGVQISSLFERLKLKILICMIERDKEIIIPDGSTELCAGDHIFFTGLPQSIDAFIKKLGLAATRVHSVMIIGGGRLTYYLAKLLIESGIKVKIIEQDEGVCENMADALPKATIVCGNGSSKELLKEEGIEQVDALMSLTGNDEENIVVSLFAKSLGVGKVITKSNNESYSDITETLNLGTIVCPKEITSEKIIRITRSMQAPEDKSVLALNPLVGGLAEAIAFDVAANPAFVGQSLVALRLKPSVMLAGIVRGREMIIPDGSTVLEVDDVIIVISAGYKFSTLDDILAI